MKNYDVILFDIDDTLFDFKKSQQEAFTKAFNRHQVTSNIHLYEKSYKEISKELWGDLESGSMNLTTLATERFRRLFAVHQLDLDFRAFSQDYLQCLSEQVHLIEGAENVVASLSHKRLAAITNGFTLVQTARMNHSSLRASFEHMIISEASGFAKPHHGIFDDAFQQLGMPDKHTALIVGDSLTSDIQGGINYGIDTCWFNPSFKKNETSFMPTYEINRLEELIDIIK